MQATPNNQCERTAPFCAINLCVWCSTALESAETASSRTCLRCRNFLTGVGLTMNEISGDWMREE